MLYLSLIPVVFWAQEAQEGCRRWVAVPSSPLHTPGVSPEAPEPCLLAFPGVKCLTVSCHLSHEPGHGAAVPALFQDGTGVTWNCPSGTCRVTAEQLGDSWLIQGRKAPAAASPFLISSRPGARSPGVGVSRWRCVTRHGSASFVWGRFCVLC